ncbi:FGGY-family carbohydrate kinase [Tessaracoccus massiliensis]|uniref:FGGY-family carbohydrate kinase n=1 Tax=Tessaracoccus massiliensis TaxID=1522311 RepID=UPI00058CEBCB|nr:FGGY family carbohydrate kinase [Tessaracoccus massiliensis]
MIVTIDLGTSGVRVALIGRDMEIRDLIRRDIAVQFDGRGGARVILNDVVQAVTYSVREILLRNEASDVSAVSFSSQGEVLFPLNPDGSPPLDFPVTMDVSGVASQHALARTMTGEEFQQITGEPLHAMFPIFKIHAQHQTEPSGGRIVALDAYIRELLGGTPVVDWTMASRSGLFDVGKLEWCEDLCSWAGVRTEMMPPVSPAASLAGAVSAAGHELTGLPVGVPLVVGSHDQACAYWGGGGVPQEIAIFSAGSSECFTQGSFGRPSVSSDPIPTYPVRENLWLSLVGIPAGGWGLDWLARLGARPVASLVAEAAARPVSPATVFPFFGGAPTFRNDPTATASMTHLSLDMDVADLARAMLEASGFELYDSIERTASILGAAEQIHCSGLGASFDATAIRADASRRTLSIISAQAALQGAALQAWVALGAIESLVGSYQPPVRARLTPTPDDQLAAKRASYLSW